MCFGEIMEKYAKQAIDKIMESNRNQGFDLFKTVFKTIFHKFIGESFEELKDGFKEGEEDVMVWIQYNVSEYNNSIVPPNQKMIAMMKTQQQMAMIKVAYNGYLNDKEKTEEVKQAPIQAPVPVAVPVQTVAPVQSTPQVDPAIAARREMMLKFKAILEADKIKMKEMDEDQKPLSRAYLSISSFTKGKTLSKEEEKITKADGYHADKNKKLSTM